MANCTAADVRLIIDTGLTDTNLGSLITLADAEMTARGMTGVLWTTNLKKQVSMLLAASLASMNDARSHGREDYKVSTSLPKYYRERAEELINHSSEPALLSWNDPIPDGDEE